MKTKRKLLSMLLVVCIVTGLLPVTAFAVEGGQMPAKAVQLGTAVLGTEVNTESAVLRNSHVHVYSELWISSETHHWHDCTAADCPIDDDSQKQDYGMHDFSNWTITEYATETTDGTKERVCDTCRYKETAAATYGDCYVVLNIPYTKTVVQQGTAAPGETDFTLGLTLGREDMDDSAYFGEYVKAGNHIIATNGSGSYDGTLQLAVRRDGYGMISDGFYVYEKDDAEDGWTYDATRWIILPEIDGSVMIYEDMQPAPMDQREAENIGFTNTYTKDTPVPVTYTLTFETNGGGRIDPVTRNAGTVIGLDAYIPIWDGYTFCGWYSDRDLTDKVDSVTLDRDKTVYAKWEKSDGEPTDPITPTDPTEAADSTDPITPTDPTEPSNPSDLIKSPQTGDTKTFWPYLLMILAGCGVMLIGKRRVRR